MKSYFYIALCCFCVGNFMSHANNLIPTQFGENKYTGYPALKVLDKRLYAAGPDGILCLDADDSAEWEFFSMKGFNVIDFIFSGDKVMATIVPEGTEERYTFFYKLVTGMVGGTEFSDITPAQAYYRPEVNENYFSPLSQHPDNPEVVLINCYKGVVESENFGESWDVINETLAISNNRMFFGYHPYFPSKVFYLNQTYYRAPYLRISEDGGKNWGDPCDTNLLDASYWYSLTFDPKDPNHIHGIGKNNIMESFDGGENWCCVVNDFDVNIDFELGMGLKMFYDPSDVSNNTVFAIGYETKKGKSFRSILKSTDRGHTWENFYCYNYGELENVLYDVALFDGKIWFYESSDIYYVELNAVSGVEDIHSVVPVPTKFYDLNGRELRQTLPGSVYIKDGRKFIAR